MLVLCSELQRTKLTYHVRVMPTVYLFGEERNEDSKDIRDFVDEHRTDPPLHAPRSQQMPTGMQSALTTAVWQVRLVSLSAARLPKEQRGSLSWLAVIC
jgi:hypothetical protein